MKGKEKARKGGAMPGDQQAVDSARLEGMKLALELVKKGGAELLEGEIRAREQMGVNPPVPLGNLDSQLERVLIHAIRQVFCISVGAIHDCYGFGPKRLQPFLDKFSEGTSLLMKGFNGGALLKDYAGEIEDTYKITLWANKHGVLIKKKGDSSVGGISDQGTDRRRLGRGPAKGKGDDGEESPGETQAPLS